MTSDKGQLLLRIARTAIAEALNIETPMIQLPEASDWLHDPGACFVTLKLDSRLRGCIGSIEAHRPLLDDIRANAKAAALRDPRFPPLRVEEFDRTHIEVSLLTRPIRLPAQDETSAIAKLHPGRDGVLLEYGHHRSTFLPQVWEEIPNPRHFLAQLKIKAGLAPDFWHPELLLSIYEVEKFAENGTPTSTE